MPLIARVISTEIMLSLLIFNKMIKKKIFYCPSCYATQHLCQDFCKISKQRWNVSVAGTTALDREWSVI